MFGFWGARRAWQRFFHGRMTMVGTCSQEWVASARTPAKRGDVCGHGQLSSLKERERMSPEKDSYPAPVRAFDTHLTTIDERVIEAREVSDRRGSKAWRVVTSGGLCALKANADPDGEVFRDKRSELDREAMVIAELTRLGAIPADYLVGAGPWEAGRWLAVRWAPGDLMWNALAPARDQRTTDTRRLLVACARTMARAATALHLAGWVHADIQPTNTLVDESGSATLVDYALAHGPMADGPPDLETGRIPYRGALTHTTAPEIAQALLDTAHTEHIRATAAADVWALGASLFWCWTGCRPVPYRQPDGPRLGKLQDIAMGITLDVASARPWPFPGFEEAVTCCLSADPQARPTAAEFLSLLDGVD